MPWGFNWCPLKHIYREHTHALPLRHITHPSHPEYCTFTAHRTYTSHSHTQAHHIADTHTQIQEMLVTHMYRGGSLSCIQLLMFQHWLGDHLPPPAANHSHCHHHYHHCHHSRNISHGQDVSESTQLCPRRHLPGAACLP